MLDEGVRSTWTYTCGNESGISVQVTDTSRATANARCAGRL